MATPGARSLDGAIVGSVLVLLGGLALGEAWRLHGPRTEMVAGAVVGDDTFPFAVAPIGTGATPEEAVAQLREARQSLIRVLLDRSDPIPEPRPLKAAVT